MCLFTQKSPKLYRTISDWSWIDGISTICWN